VISHTLEIQILNIHKHRRLVLLKALKTGSVCKSQDRGEAISLNDSTRWGELGSYVNYVRSFLRNVASAGYIHFMEQQHG
jgi:hypothetical protein